MKVTYDLTLFVRERGVDPLVTLERLCSTSLSDELSEVDRARMRLRAAILRTAYPMLDEFEAEQFIELTSVEPGFGAQVTIYHQSVDFTLPFWWESRAEAEEGFQKVWACAQALMKEAPFVVHDPQLGRIINLERDLPAVLTKYLQGVNSVRVSMGKEPLAEPDDKPRRWWKFWGA